MFHGTGLASVADMTRFVIQTQIHFSTATLRRLPYGDELIQYAGQTWSLMRHYAATHALAVRDYASGLADSVRQWGAGGNAFQYWVGLTTGSYLEGAGGMISAVIVDPLSTIEGVGSMVGQYYERGGVIGVVAGMTGVIGLYESYSGVDYL